MRSFGAIMLVLVFGFGIALAFLWISYQDLLMSYYALKQDYENLKKSYQELDENYQSLQQDYQKLKIENQALQTMLQGYAGIPPGYYATDAYPNHQNTLEELERFISQEFNPPLGYEEGVFDCSDSSAYLEWALEDAGFDAYIVVGACPWDPSRGSHAWVLVRTDEGEWVAIEATHGWIVYKDYTSEYSRWCSEECYQRYYSYDEMYSNIYQAVERYYPYYGYSEWDWWREYGTYVRLFRYAH